MSDFARFAKICVGSFFGKGIVIYEILFCAYRQNKKRYPKTRNKVFMLLSKKTLVIDHTKIKPHRQTSPNNIIGDGDI